MFMHSVRKCTIAHLCQLLFSLVYCRLSICSIGHVMKGGCIGIYVSHLSLWYLELCSVTKDGMINFFFFLFIFNGIPKRSLFIVNNISILVIQIYSVRCRCSRNIKVHSRLCFLKFCFTGTNIFSIPFFLLIAMQAELEEKDRAPKLGELHLKVAYSSRARCAGRSSSVILCN